MGLWPVASYGSLPVVRPGQLETPSALLTDNTRSRKGTRQTYGIMRADAHKGDMLLHDGEIRLIDLSFCSCGDCMLDLGVCLYDMGEELHQAFLDGSQSLRALPAGHEQLVEGFFVGSTIGTFSFWTADPGMQEVLVSRVPRLSGTTPCDSTRGNASGSRESPASSFPLDTTTP